MRRYSLLKPLLLPIPKTILWPDSTSSRFNAPEAVAILNVPLVLSEKDACVEFAEPLTAKAPPVPAWPTFKSYLKSEL